MADPLVIVTAIGAGVAIAQPWAIAAYKKWIRKGAIEIYNSGLIEVGYSNFGPTIALLGTLRALHREMFVARAEVSVVRKKDESRHAFDWLAFRPNILSVRGPGAPSEGFEIATGFMVTPNAPRKYNIFFADQETRREMDPAIALTHDALAEAKKQLGVDDVVLGSRLRSNPSAVTKVLKQIEEKYNQHEKKNDAFSELTRILYWHAGTYQLKMTIHCTRPDREFSHQWQFTLSEEDANTIRFNVLNILELPVDGMSGYSRPFFLAFPEYQETHS